ncbi:MAG: hypothetical protein DRQ60_09680 [Gammaproteobacteria bacterium]|nr:MAG: hypothetical protein DRQ54_10615 [Gammaproteobacteria bacterium]RLA11361.1 MAG: hypothetical protein DRQ52_09745 [Gammaproteobacteria bacterium]RLA11643.1 MAG: hypothetical protein DRQ60_09680 [Gammaproteobacteria bacterium]
MGLKTGAQYRELLNDGRALYIGGERVKNPNQYAPLQGIIKTISEHYDDFHKPELQARYTYASPADGAPVSNSFLEAVTWEQMEQRIIGETLRKEATYGMMGRMPDFMNAFVTDLAVIAPHVLGHKDKTFADNAINYYQYCRDQDICVTHTLADPRKDYSKPLGEQNSVRIVREADDGIYVTGARMLSTLAPVSHELFVGPFMPRQPGEEAMALCFAIPVATAGVKFISRESYARGRSTFDRPLSERFDEGDSLVVFDNAFIPWERVFIAGDLVAHNMLAASFPGYLALQANIRGRAKLRFMIGLAVKMAKTLGRSELPRYRELIGEMLGFSELADGLVEATAREVQRNAVEEMAKQHDPNFNLVDVAKETAMLFGSVDRGMVGLASLRFFMPMVNTRVNELIRLIGSSSMVITTTEADFAHPDIADDLEKYMSGAEVGGKQRVQIMKLAWDAVASEFGGRQEIYEIFFAGDPFMGRQLHYQTPKRDQFEAMVTELLEKDD